MGILNSLFGVIHNSKSPPNNNNSNNNNSKSDNILKEALISKASKNNKLLVDNISEPKDTTTYYSNSDLVNTCVSFISDIASQVEIKIYEDRNGELISTKNKFLQQWQNNPNPFMPMSLLIKGYIQSYLISGNAYLTFEKIGGKYESWILASNKVKIVPDSRKYISGYIFSDEVSYKSEEVIFFKNIESINGYYGLSPLISLTDILLTEGYATDDLKSFYENSLILSGILSSEYPLSESQINSLKQQFNTLFARGGSERHGFLIASNNLKYDQLKLNPKDGLILEALNITEDRVYQAYKVDKVLLGRSNGSSANIREIKVNFLNNVIRPLVYQLLQTFETHFKRVFKNDNIRVKSDWSNIPEIVDSIQQKIDYVAKAQQIGILSINESRELLNLTPIKDKYADDRFLASYLLGVNPTTLNGETLDILSATNQQPDPNNGNVNGGAENEQVR